MRRAFPAALVAVWFATVISGQVPAAPAAAADARLDAAFTAFWDASPASALDKAAQQIVATGASVDAIAAKLKTGRPYTKQRTGRLDMPASDRGNSLDNVVEVPAEYDAARKWPVRVSLHGGVGREMPGPNDAPARPLSNRIPSSGEIVIHPRAWALSEWWTAGQVENISKLLDRVKRAYNVDESRVYVTGISDGGTGVYFLGMRAATPWAACMPLNGHPSVLANPATGADGTLFSGNLANCPLYIVNGGRDPLYPAASVKPMIDMFERGGIPLVFQVYPEAGHNVEWWPQERPRYEAFLGSHARVAHPGSITWETERTDRYNRFRWLVIDRLGKRPSDQALPDVNVFEAGALVRRPLYDRPRASGRADVTRRGNSFDVKSRGVHELTLLLSPDVVDFTKPVRVTVNGKAVHDALVKADPATMLEWAARDHDRTMIYAATLKVVVP
jgi:dienelactone hydrolase